MFVGKRQERLVDDFLWEMEQYFEGVNIIDDGMKIKTATRYLKDTATLWWRRRHADIERGMCVMNTWDDFVRELKRQLYPENAIMEAKIPFRNFIKRGLFMTM